MSHTTTVDLKIDDLSVVDAAAVRLGLKTEEGTFDLFETKNEEGKAVWLPGWNYPVVIKKDGSVAYDNYNGRWGNEEEFTKFQAYYGLEKTKVECRKKGYSIQEYQDEEGNIGLIAKEG